MSRSRAGPLFFIFIIINGLPGHIGSQWCTSKVNLNSKTSSGKLIGYQFHHKNYILYLWKRPDFIHLRKYHLEFRFKPFSKMYTRGLNVSRELNKSLCAWSAFFDVENCEYIIPFRENFKEQGSLSCLNISFDFKLFTQEIVSKKAIKCNFK